MAARSCALLWIILGTIEHPSRQMVGNAIAALTEALPEEMKMLIVAYANNY
jgi:hypothetical protein